MKKYLTLFALLISINLIAQINTKVEPKKFDNIETSLFDCIYEYKIIPSNGIEENYYTILQVGNNMSKFWDYSSFAYDSVTYVASATSPEIQKKYKASELRQVYHFDTSIFQNYPKGKITVNGIITPNYYTYTEDRNISEWELHPDTLTICDNLCYKATTKYGGREWIAWYSPSIATTYGPWKFSNLPGLILMAEDSEKIHQFKAISIRQNKLPIYNEKNAQRIKTSRGKFISSKNEFEKDPMNNIPVESIEGMNVTRFGDGPNDKTATINGVPLRIRPNGYTPLENK